MKVIDPMQNPEIRPYLDDVRAWHGYVRFLGLPTIQDNPDTPIDNLFVPPLLSHEAVIPDTDPSSWPKGQDIFSLLKQNRRLVILGDPGGGKTTLLNWLAWLLVSGRVGLIPKWLEDTFPIPLVLRELDLRGVDSFETLIAAFLKRPVAAKLREKQQILTDYLKQGKVIVTVDGFDEVPRAIQQNVRQALWEGFRIYPKSYFVASSRPVGYEDCRLDRGIAHVTSVSNKLAVVNDIDLLWENKSTSFKEIKSRVSSSQNINTLNFDALIDDFMQDMVAPAVVYVIPFDNDRIRKFASSWYQLRTFRQVATNDAREFLNAVFANTTILRLARTPQLLTLMALVFRVRAQLPDGRALLYDLISEAYLESIDRSRKILQDPYPWKEKRRWLARIAFEMQLLRTARKSSNTKADNDLMIHGNQVLDWIQVAMEHSGYKKDATFAKDYLNWIARRSGLLLPRGENLFSFLHLSFQEYFAALYLVEHLGDPDWVISQRDGVSYKEGDPRITAKSIQFWSNDIRWQEVLVFCFEEFAHSPKEARRLLEWIYGREFCNFKPQASFYGFRAKPVAELLARIVVDPHSGLSPQYKELSFIALSAYHLHLDDVSGSGGFCLTETASLRLLCTNQHYSAKFWQLAEKTNIVMADIESLSNEFITRLQNWPNISTLFIMEFKEFGLELLTRCTKLHTLFLSGTKSKSLQPLIRLKKLSFLSISGVQFEDISPLRYFKNLSYLNLDGSRVSDITPLSELNKLQTLTLRRAQISDIASLVGLTNLLSLDLTSSSIKDLTPLSSMALTELVLNETSIADLRPLNRIVTLEILELDRTNIKNLKPLSLLKNIKRLSMRKTKIDDLRPVANLTNLEFLDVSGTDITDLSPLATLENLKELLIAGTKVTNVVPLAHLPKLEEIVLDNGQMVGLNSLKHIKTLKMQSRSVPRGRTRSEGV